jgi:hypothetical protein
MSGMSWRACRSLKPLKLKGPEMQAHVTAYKDSLEALGGRKYHNHLL